MTVNVTSWGTGQSVFEQEGLRWAQAVWLQETHLTKAAGVAASAKLLKQGWQSSFTEAICTPGGKGSGGVAFAAAQSVGMGYCPLVPTGTLVRGRIQAMHLNAIAPGGVLCVNVYMVAGAELSEENWALWMKLGRLLKIWKGPFVVGGDFQTEPAAVEETGWLHQVDGTIIHPNEGTVTPSGRTIDWWIVSKSFAKGAKAYVDDTMPVRPHKAVWLEIGEIEEPTIWAVSGPKRFPDKPVPTCRKPAMGLHWEKAISECTKTDMDNQWLAFMATYEEDLVDMLHLEEDRNKYTGRTLEVVRVRRKALQPKVGAYPRISPLGTAIECWCKRAECWPTLGTYSFNSWQRSLRKVTRMVQKLRWKYAGVLVHLTEVLQWLQPHENEKLVMYLRHYALQQHKIAKTAALKGWNEWAAQSTLNGASKAYMFTRVPQEWVPSEVMVELAPADRQNTVECMAKEWATVWGNAMENVEPFDLSLMPLVQPTDSIDAEEVKEAAQTFRYNTGQNWDRVSPRFIALLPEAARQWIAKILNQCECEGKWPKASNRVVFIAKREGGLRPIGLLPVLIRLHARIRKKAILQWEHSNKRAYIGGTKGTSADRCAWQQLALQEWATLNTSGHTALVLLDLWKAFEQAQFTQLLRAAHYYEFPMNLLRMAVAACALPRILDVEGATSIQIFTRQGIVPGHGYATTLLKLLLLRPMDHVVQSYPLVRINTYVDDIALQQSGSMTMVRAQLGNAVPAVIWALQDVGLLISKKKTRLLCANDRLADILKPVLRGAGAKRVRHERNLGVDHTVGKARRTGVAQVRAKATVIRTKRLRILAGGMQKTPRKLLGNMAATTVTAARLYGVCAQGISTTQLQTVRTQVAAALDPQHVRKSTTMALALLGSKNLDPAFRAHMEPLAVFIEEYQARRLPPFMLEQAMQAAAPKIVAWNAVNGPVAALVATLRRIGWTPTVDGMVWRTDMDAEVLMRRIDSFTAKALVHGSVQRWLAAKTAVHFGIPAIRLGFAIKPLIQAMGKSSLTGKEKTYLRTLCIGQQWPQARLYEAGYTDTNLCQACHIGVGTLEHRHMDCAAQESWRRAQVSPEMVVLRRQRTHSTRSLCEFPFVPCRMAPTGLTPAQDTYEHGAHDGVMAYFVDGSVRHPREPAISTATWAAVGVALGEDGMQVAWGRRGRLPHAVQHDIDGAELWAMKECLRHAAPGLPIYSDSSYVVQGILQWGRERCIHPSNNWAGVWTELWRIIDDWGGPGNVDVRKVKAHTTCQDVAEGRVTPMQRFGNNAADEWAKHHNELAVQTIPEGVYLRNHVVATALADWAARRGAQGVHRDTCKTMIAKKPKDLAERRKPGQHVWDKDKTPARCINCERISGLQKLDCPGTLVQQAVMAQQQLCAQGKKIHHILRVNTTKGQLLICTTCAGVARMQLRHMGQACRGVASQAGKRMVEAVQRSKQLSPKYGVALSYLVLPIGKATRTSDHSSYIRPGGLAVSIALRRSRDADPWGIRSGLSGAALSLNLGKVLTRSPGGGQVTRAALVARRTLGGLHGADSNLVYRNVVVAAIARHGKPRASRGAARRHLCQRTITGAVPTLIGLYGAVKYGAPDMLGGLYGADRSLVIKVTTGATPSLFGLYGAAKHRVCSPVRLGGLYGADSFSGCCIRVEDRGLASMAPPDGLMAHWGLAYLVPQGFTVRRRLQRSHGQLFGASLVAPCWSAASAEWTGESWSCCDCSYASGLLRCDCACFSLMVQGPK
jgi:ribonuclease HI